MKIVGKKFKQESDYFTPCPVCKKKIFHGETCVWVRVDKAPPNGPIVRKFHLAHYICAQEKNDG